VVELVDFKSVEDQVDEVLVDLVHLNDEVSLVYGLILRIFADFVQYTLILELIELMAHVVRP